MVRFMAASSPHFKNFFGFGVGGLGHFWEQLLEQFWPFRSQPGTWLCRHVFKHSRDGHRFRSYFSLITFSWLLMTTSLNNQEISLSIYTYIDKSMKTTNIISLFYPPHSWTIRPKKCPSQKRPAESRALGELSIQYLSFFWSKRVQHTTWLLAGDQNPMNFNGFHVERHLVAVFR